MKLLHLTRGQVVATLAMVAPLAAASSLAGPADEFGREGGKNRAFKDALEGLAPPALVVDGWLNTDGTDLTLDSLQGKVVVLDFWGTW